MDKIEPDTIDTELTEQPLTDNELDRWNTKLEKTLQNNFRYPTGIKLSLTTEEKIRWVRSRIRKDAPKQIDEERLESCRILIRKGNSTHKISKVMKIGYHRVIQLRSEMRRQERNS